MNFKGSARRITSADITRVANSIGCGEDELHAVMDVEAAGSGFDGQGRPKMLFEPHLFYRALKGQSAKLQAAISTGLAYASWRPGAYPKDSYPRLTAAMAIDETAALASTSWGLGQILGSNHRACGYATPQAMVAAFVESEANQLQGMANFIRSRGLEKAMQRHDWHAFARGYNGPAYAKHNYHGKLAAAFAKWQARPDSPPPPDLERDPIPTVEPPIPPAKKGRKETAGAIVASGAATAAATSARPIVIVSIIAAALFVAALAYVFWPRKD